MKSKWEEIQQDIWDCTACKNVARAELNIRQQTEPIRTSTKLLVVGIAPPYKDGMTQKVQARSATNDPGDNFRNFIETVLELPWDTLKGSGLVFLHAVKCAIRPEDRHQNPPSGVVETCAPRHFYREFLEIKPKAVISFGERARRAVLKMPGCQKPRGLKLSGPLTGQHEMLLESHTFTLFVSPFFLADYRQAEETLRAAALYAEII